MSPRFRSYRTFKRDSSLAVACILFLVCFVVLLAALDKRKRDSLIADHSAAVDGQENFDSFAANVTDEHLEEFNFMIVEKLEYRSHKSILSRAFALQRVTREKIRGLLREHEDTVDAEKGEDLKHKLLILSLERALGICEALAGAAIEQQITQTLNFYDDLALKLKSTTTAEDFDTAAFGAI